MALGRRGGERQGALWVATGELRFIRLFGGMDSCQALTLSPEFWLSDHQLSLRKSLHLLVFFRGQVQRGLLGLVGMGDQTD